MWQIGEVISTTLSIKVATQSSRKQGKKMARDRGTSEDVAFESDAPEVVKEPKAKKEPTRGTLPEGYVTPVGLAKIISERGLHINREGVAAVVAPQVVYSYIKNAPKEHLFPMEHIADSLGKVRDVVQIEEAVAWWIAKNERVAAGKIASADKAAKKAAKAAAAEAEVE